MNHHSGHGSSSPSSSSSTLASESSPRSKPIKRPASPTVQSHDEHHHLSPPIPVTTLDEGSEGLKTVVPPNPLGLGGVVPDDVDEDEKRDGGSRDVHMGSAGDVEAGRPPAKDVFDRFSPTKKKVIVAIVAYCAFLCPITSAIFLPSIPQIAEELNTSSSTIAYTVAIFIVVMGAAPLIWSPLSGFYGRRLVYITSLPILVLASIGVALSPNIGALIATRILQAIGGSCVLAVGAGSIGDIYRPTERGTAMGWYYSGNLMGPTFAPVFGGLFSQYTKPGWRSAQYFVAGLGAVACVLVVFVLPETSHPPTPHEKMKAATGKKFVIYRFNPLTSLGLFRWINICAMSVSSAAVLLSIYTLLVPLSTLFKDRYHISNLAILGCLYLPSGIGNLIGARIAGPLADRTVKKYLAKRGYRRTEDRLRASVLWSLLMPVTLIAYGWLVQTGAGGIAAPLVISVLPSASLMGILTPQNTYLIDSMPTRSAEVIAVNNFLRYLASAAASAWVLPMSQKIGWGWTMTVSGALVWCSTLVLIATMKWGDGWREKANQKYHYEGTPADCRRPVDSITSSSTKVGSDVGSDHGETEEVGHLPVSLPLSERKGRRSGKDQNVAEGQGQMPPVHEVLKRTVSLSGASVHGGG